MKEIFVPLCSALVRLHLEYAPTSKKRRIQTAAKRWVKDLRGPIYEVRFKALKLQSLEKRRLSNNLVQTKKIPFNQNRSESNSTVQVLQKARTKKFNN